MKGLLLKDLYMIKHYCRLYIVMAVLFLVAGTVSGGEMFFITYPCIIAAMLPVTLMGYDERSKWCDYCRTMPYTKGQIVASKYIITVCMITVMLLLCTGAMAVKISMLEGASMDELLVLIPLLTTVACISSSISLPFMFKLGVEKGRVAYYVMIGVCAGGSVLAANVVEADMNSTLNAGTLPPLLCLASVLIFALSWYLSVRFYKKREC